MNWDAEWLRHLAEGGGVKGVVSPVNVDARALRRIADHIDRLEKFQLGVFIRIPSRPPYGLEHTDAFKVKAYNELRDHINSVFLEEAK